jgi:hypothetical protein
MDQHMRDSDQSSDAVAKRPLSGLDGKPATGKR